MNPCTVPRRVEEDARRKVKTSEAVITWLRKVCPCEECRALRAQPKGEASP